MSIGQTLAAARREAGLSVEDVSAKTRVRATVIRAIENDDFSLCGGDFYARGHIRTIAVLVGADPAALVAEFDAEAGHVDDVPASQIFEAEVTGRSITRRTERRAPSWGIAAIVMVLLAVIVVAGVQLAKGGGSKQQAQIGAVSASQSPTPTVSPSVTSIQTPTPTPSPTTPPATPPSSAVAEAGVHVVLNVTTAKCWVLALGSNGAQLFEGTLNPGDSKTFVDAQRVSLKLGNAPATDLTVNGVDIGAPPSSSSVASVSFGPGNPTAAQG